MASFARRTNAAISRYVILPSTLTSAAPMSPERSSCEKTPDWYSAHSWVWPPDERAVRKPVRAGHATCTCEKPAGRFSREPPGPRSLTNDAA
jgi:hypothetical protein